jgi:dual specificity phosphatase 12
MPCSHYYISPVFCMVSFPRISLLTATSAMGKSRSAVVCMAYLLRHQPNLTPQSALELIKEGRPLCEPNEGFMDQINIYHQMGCPDDVTGHPIYQRWLYRRDVEDSVACGRAPEMKSVLFEDEQHRRQEPSDRTTEIKCRKCRLVFPP